jgi:hypothetical protein
MSNELSNFGDHAEVTMQSKAVGSESVGVEGHYSVVCRDADGNIKWEESFPNLVNAGGKQLMLDTLLSTLSPSTYTTVGPFLGLIDGTSPTFAASDTFTSHGGWVEYTAYDIAGNTAIRGTAAFAAATSSGSSPANVTSKVASAITFTIVAPGGTVGGCFLVTGTGATNLKSNTTLGTLYSAGAFAVPKTVTAGDTVSVTYSTTTTS